MSVPETFYQDLKISLPLYYQKWLSNLQRPLERESVKFQIEKLYQLAGLVKPQVVFCDSPISAYKTFPSLLPNESETSLKKSWKQLLHLLKPTLMPLVNRHQITCSILNDIKFSVEYFLEDELGQQVKEIIRDSQQGSLVDKIVKLNNAIYVGLVKDLLHRPLELLEAVDIRHIILDHFYPNFKLEFEYAQAGMLDCITSLGISLNQPKFEFLQQFCWEVGWFFPSSKLVVVCEKPKITWYSEDYPVAVFPDGWVVGLDLIKFSDSPQVKHIK